MGHYYSDEKNVQMLIYLMKSHGVKKVIVSPRNKQILRLWQVYSRIRTLNFILWRMNVQQRIWRVVLAAESGEPVALSCTGATASRNYIPGLTEAYYRKTPCIWLSPVRSTRGVSDSCARR